MSVMSCNRLDHRHKKQKNVDFSEDVFAKRVLVLKPSQLFEGRTCSRMGAFQVHRSYRTIKKDVHK